MEKRIKYRLYTIMYVILCLPYLFTIIAHLLNENVRLKTNTWQITELLINYQGGFVRRGIVGEFFYWLSPYIDTQMAIYVFCITCSILFFYLIFRDTIRKGYSILLLPSAFLLSSLFVSLHWVRKDIFIMLLFYFIVRLQKSTMSYKIFLMNIILIIGILSHEVFLFISLPLMYFSVIHKGDTLVQYKQTIRNVLKTALYYLPALLAGFVAVIYKGNLEQAYEIWNSWAAIDVLEGDMKGAIAAIGWTPEKAIEVGTEVFKTVRCGIVYYPIMWTLLAFFAFNVYMWMGKFKLRILGYTPTRDYNTKESAYIIICQFLSMLPLLIVFADTSRAFFYVVMSSYIIRLFDDENEYSSYFGELPSAITRLTTKCEQWVSSHKKAFVISAFVIGIPSVSISALEHVVLHGQIGFFVKSIIDLFK